MAVPAQLQAGMLLSHDKGVCIACSAAVQVLGCWEFRSSTFQINNTSVQLCCSMCVTWQDCVLRQVRRRSSRTCWRRTRKTLTSGLTMLRGRMRPRCSRARPRRCAPPSSCVTTPRAPPSTTACRIRQVRALHLVQKRGLLLCGYPASQNSYAVRMVCNFTSDLCCSVVTSQVTACSCISLKRHMAYNAHLSLPPTMASEAQGAIRCMVTETKWDM